MKFLGYIITHNIWFDILTAVAILLLIASFIMPPSGVIDSSVIGAVGELAGFGALWVVLVAIEKGTGATIAKGDMSVEIKGKEDS